MVSALAFGVVFVILLISGFVMSMQNRNQTNQQSQNGHLTTGRDLLQFPPSTNPSYTPPSLPHTPSDVSSDVTPSAPPYPSADASPYASPSAPLCPPANTTSYGSTDEEPPPYDSVVGAYGQSPPQQESSGKPPNESKTDTSAL